MAPAARDPKALAEWVELDYHGQPRGLRRWRRRMTVWLFLAALLLLGASVALSLTSGRTAKMYQAGALSLGHAAMEGDCRSCHTQPFRTARRFSPFHHADHAVANSACQQCHAETLGLMPPGARPGPAAPPHNAVVIGEPGCAQCHREHRGDLFLARTPDLHCLACHGDLKLHKGEGKTVFAAVTSTFPNGHPEFAVRREGHQGLLDRNAKPSDPFRFNHKKHLELDARYLPVGREKLTCARCHESDESGKYMRPIDHERHCAECHTGQRTVQLLGRFLDDKARTAAAEFSRIPAPHRKPAEVRDFLNGRLLTFIERNPVQLSAADDSESPWPRMRTDPAWSAVVEDRSAFNPGPFLRAQRQQLEGQLFERSGGCAYCHDHKKRPDGARSSHALPDYEPPAIPTRWLRHGGFNHQRHLMVDCAHCHDAARSERTLDVLIPKLAVCASCHSPGGGARFDCVECHKYHGREEARARAHTFPVRDVSLP